MEGRRARSSQSGPGGVGGACGPRRWWPGGPKVGAPDPGLSDPAGAEAAQQESWEHCVRAKMVPVVPLGGHHVQPVQAQGPEDASQQASRNQRLRKPRGQVLHAEGARTCLRPAGPRLATGRQSGWSRGGGLVRILVLGYHPMSGPGLPSGAHVGRGEWARLNPVEQEALCLVSE